MRVLIDGDILVYKCACAVEKEGKDFRAWKLEYNIDHMINEIINHTLARDYKVYLSGVNNFREQIATIVPYKHNRKKENRPTLYEEARQYLIDFYRAEVVEGIEADDILGIMQHKPDDNYDPFSQGLSTCIASIDKDLLMIPGNHYNLKSKHIRFVSLDEANKTYWKQVLTGDWQCDRIPGLKGVGSVTAEKMLKDETTFIDLEMKVKDTYRNAAKYVAPAGYGCGYDYETQLQGKITHSHRQRLDVFNEIKKLIWILREPLKTNDNKEKTG
jgi:5'-3' exonuclease